MKERYPSRRDMEDEIQRLRGTLYHVLGIVRIAVNRESTWREALRAVEQLVSQAIQKHM